MWLLAANLGTSDVRYLMASRAVKTFCALGGIWFPMVPFVVLFVVFHVRWSPVMLPYHIFGGKEALMQLEREGSVWYWSIFTLDWALMSAGAVGCACAFAIFCDALQHVNLVSKAMR